MQTVKVLIDGLVKDIPYDTMEIVEDNLFGHMPSEIVRRRPVINIPGYRIDEVIGGAGYEFVAHPVGRLS